MTTRFKFTIFCLLCTAIWAKAQSFENSLEAFCDSVHEANPSSVGIMVHVESPQRNISFSTASGVSSKDVRTDLNPDQPALLASNTKTFVSAAILRLVEMGRLSVDDPTGLLLSEKTRTLFEGGGYDLNAIKVKHLMSHTSGVRDYVDEEYINFVDQNQGYRWTRDEQLERSIAAGEPLGNPEYTFSYADANYLLLTEIIEGITEKPFYTAMRELLRYEDLGLNNTWMPSLEEKPKQTKTLVYQYNESLGWDSYEVDVSADLYGGGGIASTTSDLANFAYKLFHCEIVEDTTTFNLIYTKIPTQDTVPSHYGFGLTRYDVSGYTAYGHGGFWGTKVIYIPELDTSIAVFVLERDRRSLTSGIIDHIIGLLED
ncbi:serine hydrolase [Cryomorphaceae bacterium 1068]|nr:serine hydrolase [Cryomorphaceae bacterium 1068]